ncbi:MAG: hypothetical protein AB2L14_02160 [Candidatus Xenobiia bacterium LiM19]
MTINNISNGGNMLPVPVETDRKEVMKKDDGPDGPDNYPSYGDKCLIGADEPDSQIFLQDNRTKSTSDETVSEEYRIKGDEEGPDNYPSYGDKSAMPEEIKHQTPAASYVIVSQEENPDEYYIIKGPDNYPSYGDK